MNMMKKVVRKTHGRSSSTSSSSPSPTPPSRAQTPIYHPYIPDEGTSQGKNIVQEQPKEEEEDSDDTSLSDTTSPATLSDFPRIFNSRE